MEISGSIKMIGQTVQVSDKFSKRELVIVTNEKYPQSILIEFNQDACGLLDNYSVGSEVTVNINLRGRSWTNPKDGVEKHFNTIQGWKIGYAGKHATDLQGAADMINKKIAEDDLQDLPF